MNVIRRGEVERLYRTLPVGKRPVFLRCWVSRLKCLDCGWLRQAKTDFADDRRSYTRRFERYALELSRRMTIKDVAAHLGVSWHTIKDIQKRYLGKRFLMPKLKHLRLIAIDEISIGRGHRYFTVVQDLETGAVVFVGDGKGSDALKPFWPSLRASGAKVRAVAIDMSPAYLEAVSTHLKQATIVFDHFHLIKLYNEKLSDLRRDLYREARDQLKKNVLKGTRWLLLKNPDHLDPKRKGRQRLEEALQLNQPLATAYYMKEDLRQLWSQPNKSAAEMFLKDWIARAESSGIAMLKKFAKTLAGHPTGILAYYYPISTGPP